MIDALFKNRSEHTEKGVEMLAKVVGLDLERFRAVMKDKALLKQIERNKIEGLRLGVKGTPALYFNGKRYQLRKDAISLEVDIPPDLPAVVCVPQEIEQVFLNLLNNARYALNQRYPEGAGRKILRIEARVIAGPDEPLVRVSFRDSGTGIPREALAKVMSPFFSTKPKGEGTGLGLSISQDLVRKNAGAMSIDSRLGEYTSVNVDLPEVRM